MHLQAPDQETACICGADGREPQSQEECLAAQDELAGLDVSAGVIVRHLATVTVRGHRRSGLLVPQHLEARLLFYTTASFCTTAAAK